MSKSLPFDVTMDCPKCKKALYARIQERFKIEIHGSFRNAAHAYTANSILDCIIKDDLKSDEELAK